MIILPIDGITADNLEGYTVDTGEDIAVPKGTVVKACADGFLVYSERGHTPWSPENHPECPNDTPYSILLEFDTPQTINGKAYNYAWYTHLSKLYHNVPDGGVGLKVKAGDKLGETGLGNNSPHLHFALLIRRAQAAGDYMPQPELHAYLKRLITTVVNTKELTVKGFFHDGKCAIVLPDGTTVYFTSFEFTGKVKS